MNLFAIFSAFLGGLILGQKLKRIYKSEKLIIARPNSLMCESKTRSTN